MVRTRCALAVIGALLVMPGVGIHGASAASRSVRLTANVLPGLGRLTVLGSPRADEFVHIGVGLRRPHDDAEQALLRAQYDPASPLYHHFLTPAEFGARFGVDRATFDAMTSWLGKGGLRVTHRASSRDYVQAVGTVKQVERLFSTRLRRFEVGGKRFQANTLAPLVPAQLGIESVIGLNTLQRFQLFPQAAPAQGLHTGLLSAKDLWSVYEQPADNLGEGETMAIFGYGPADEVIRDLREFERLNGFPQVPVVVKHVGAGPFTDSSGAIEWNLDTQASLGMAPHVQREDLYFTHSLLDPDVAAAFSAWASDPDGPRQASASFGECESDPLNPILGNPAVQPQKPPTQQLGNNLQPVNERILRQAVMEGRTLFASAGDTGSSCAALVLPVVGAGNGLVNQVVPLASYPDASPYVVGVGGTVLYTRADATGTRALERAWEFGGGGPSSFITAPDYQRGVQGLVGRCLVDPTGSPTNTLQLCRGTPDVAAISGDVISNGYDIVVHGTPGFSGGGTSLSSPLWLGMWARVQAASRQPQGLGFANPALYRVAKDPVARAKAFTDVTTGTNGLFLATPGWDYVSGWGTPRLAGLMQQLDGTTKPRRDVAPPQLTPRPILDPACGPLWTDDIGDDNFAYDLRGAGQNPQLDLQSARMTLEGGHLRTSLVITDLRASVPAPGAANVYYLTWRSGKTTYFAQAEVSLDGTVSFASGVVENGSFNTLHTATGRFLPGPQGTIEIDVPTADVGGPGAGAVMVKPTGRSTVLVGTPAVGLVQTVDVGGPDHDHVLRAGCA